MRRRGTGWGGEITWGIPRIGKGWWRNVRAEEDKTPEADHKRRSVSVDPFGSLGEDVTLQVLSKADTEDLEGEIAGGGGGQTWMTAIMTRIMPTSMTLLLNQSWSLGRQPSL